MVHFDPKSHVPVWLVVDDSWIRWNIYIVDNTLKGVVPMGSKAWIISTSSIGASYSGVGAGALGTLGAVALGATGPAVVVGMAVAAVGATVAGGFAAEKAVGKDAASAANHFGDDFYKDLQEEPFKSTKVRSITKSFRSSPFLPVATNSSMLTILLLLSKYRLRNVPVIESGQPSIKNFITHSAVIQELEGGRGRDWFDEISKHPLTDLDLPFMSPDQVISIQSNNLILAKKGTSVPRSMLLNMAKKKGCTETPGDIGCGCLQRLDLAISKLKKRQQQL